MNDTGNQIIINKMIIGVKNRLHMSKT